MRLSLFLLLFFLAGCESKPSAPTPAAASSTPKPAVGATPSAAPKSEAPRQSMLALSRASFQTKIVSKGEDAGPAEVPPPGSGLSLVQYDSPVGKLAAYVTDDPGDGKRHPAIVWITGGDNNSIGGVWEEAERDNDQTAAQFRQAGIVTMYPSQRGGNDNPGQREGFLGEVDDVLAATDWLAKLPYVDPDRIYLGGHSTGGTLAMLVGESSPRYKAVFALGPVETPAGYGGDFLYCDPNDVAELALRSPMMWLQQVDSPMYVFEGDGFGNLDSLQAMAKANKNPKIRFFPVPGHDHFSVIAPLNEVLAAMIANDAVVITSAMMAELE